MPKRLKNLRSRVYGVEIRKILPEPYTTYWLQLYLIQILKKTKFYLFFILEINYFVKGFIKHDISSANSFNNDHITNQIVKKFVCVL